MCHLLQCYRLRVLRSYYLTLPLGIEVERRSRPNIYELHIELFNRLLYNARFLSEDNYTLLLIEINQLILDIPTVLAFVPKRVLPSRKVARILRAFLETRHFLTRLLCYFASCIYRKNAMGR